MTEVHYQERFSKLVKTAASIEQQLREYLANTPHIDRISARAQSVDRFIAKSQKMEGDVLKYSDPLSQIQDQIGARVIVFYLSDVPVVSKIIEDYYRPVESKSLVPESEWEFGYFGMHYILLMPTDLVDSDAQESVIPEFFELQIKTLFQHAWSEANHDLGYKPGSKPLAADEKRRLAFTAAQAWGADHIFDELSKR
jgi:ppGpp synthetase/RelA/SpoT-type nucleotidyltranferase